MTDKKKFGLVMPKKPDTLKTQTNSIFNDESDDEEHVKKRPKIPQKKIIQKKSIKSELELDATIYEYDSIYDEMKIKQAESSAPKEVKKSRYIETLLKAADKRKKELERRIDRKIQVEREKEGDQFKDKDAFVTSSYKKKLQEKEEEEERERRENMLNDMMDVTKQKDLSGFYRHFLNQTVGEKKVPLFGEKLIKKEIVSDGESTSNKIDENLNNAINLDQDSDGIEIDNEDDDSERDFSSNEKAEEKEKKRKTETKIQYRDKRDNKKKHSSSSISKKLKKTESPKHDKIHSGKSKVPLFGEKLIKKEVGSDGESTSNKIDENLNNAINLDQDSDGIEIDNEDDDSERDFSSNEKAEEKEKKRKAETKIQYRDKRDSKKKHSSSNISNKLKKPESPKHDKIHLRKSNTNSSSDACSSDYEDNETTKKFSHSDKNKKDGKKDTTKQNSRHDSSSSDDEHSNKSIEIQANKEEKELSKEEKQRNIYAKRTVGDVFTEAQARYFQRMAMRNS